MTHGFDTSFLVAAEVAAHPRHVAARARLLALRQAGDDFALAPQVLAGFVHVVSDPKRFSQPLPMPAALDRAEAWWHSAEVRPVFPNPGSVGQFFTWMRTHRLGRNRILDTRLAATYREAGIGSVLTLNARDFQVLGGFQLLTP